MSKSKPTAVEVVAPSSVPAFLVDYMSDNRGNENVSAADIVIPRVDLIQGLSKARKKSDPAYVPGAEEGMLYNNVTRELYGPSVTICPVLFRKEWLLWRDVDKGGGFGGSYPDEISARHAMAAQDVPEEWGVVDTNVHFVLVVRDDGSYEEAVFSMAKTKAKTSRMLNSLVRINGGPRFSRLYTLTGVPEQNRAGQDYYSLQVANAGFVTESIFRHAERVYEMVKSGRASADYSMDEMHDAEM